MKRSVVTAALAVAMAGCQTVQPSIQTASGRPEKTFANATADLVQAELARACMSRKGVIENSTSSQVLCAKETEGGDAILAQLLIGNSYSTTPVIKVRFTIVPAGPNTMVQAYQWVETQMAMGQVRTVELNSGQQFNSIQALLEAADANIQQSLKTQPAASTPLGHTKPSQHN